jgi:hypothetical protein
MPSRPSEAYPFQPDPAGTPEDVQAALPFALAEEVRRLALAQSDDADMLVWLVATGILAGEDGPAPVGAVVRLAAALVCSNAAWQGHEAEDGRPGDAVEAGLAEALTAEVRRVVCADGAAAARGGGDVLVWLIAQVARDPLAPDARSCAMRVASALLRASLRWRGTCRAGLGCL